MGDDYVGGLPNIPSVCLPCCTIRLARSYATWQRMPKKSTPRLFVKVALHMMWDLPANKGNAKEAKQWFIEKLSQVESLALMVFPVSSSVWTRHHGTMIVSHMTFITWLLASSSPSKSHQDSVFGGDSM